VYSYHNTAGSNLTFPRLTVWSEKLVQAGLTEKSQRVLFADAAGLVWFWLTIVVVVVMTTTLMMMMMMIIIIIIIIIIIVERCIYLTNTCWATGN
jgi:hypothetical protein